MNAVASENCIINEKNEQRELENLTFQEGRIKQQYLLLFVLNLLWVSSGRQHDAGILGWQ